MATHSFTIEIQSINMYKFGSLMTGAPVNADLTNSINLLSQVHEVTIYESIFESLMRAEIAVYDYIGLFTNFPMTGEEIIIVRYKHVGEILTRTWTFAIDSIRHISIEDKNRAVAYIINCVSIEALSNSLAVVQKSYKATPSEIVNQLTNDFIFDRIKKFYPSYSPPKMDVESNNEPSAVFVVPALHPLAAIDMLSNLTYAENSTNYSYLFYQNYEGFNYKTLQALITNPTSLAYAKENRYKYLSDEVNDRESKLNNEDRLINNLQFNKRHSSIQKLSLGYFNNNLYEINIAQKAFQSTRTKRDQMDIVTINPHDFNTKEYKQWADSIVEGDEASNRTRYAITTRPEHDSDYPVYRARYNWGKNLITKAALAQVDVSAVLTNIHKLNAGDMFFLEIPQFHGFENVATDDLVSGYYLISEVKRIIRIGSYQSTVLGLRKDSYNNTVDRFSTYARQYDY